tara:strand:- start:2661 stop:3920 length:1260 start_codon:yes stop_codon:yes gene_type:complete
MAATYVNNLRVAEPADGDADWGTTTNASLELIGEALGVGSEAITTNADTHTSTVADGAADQARAMYLKYTGTLDSACTITIGPNTMKRFQIIENATGGSQSIIISQGGGANITIPTGAVKAIYLDGAGAGAAVVDALIGLDLTGTTTAAALTASGNVTVSAGNLVYAGTAITSTGAELNILDGVTATAAELNILDGVTSTAAELNILDGVTSTTAELNILDGVTSTAAELNILDGVTSTTAELNILDGVTSTAAELNILDGVTSTAAELNILDGVTSTAAEINLLDGLDRGSILYGNASSATTVLGQGSVNQVLTSDGTDIAWQDAGGGAYSAWLVKTANFACAAGDQLVCVSSSAFTITLPSGTTVGRSITLNNSGTASVAIARNSQPIGGVADDGVLQPDATTQLVYVNSTIGWKEL